MVICGREIGTDDLGWLQDQAPHFSMRSVAAGLARRLGWIGPNGNYQRSVAMQVLRALRDRGLLSFKAYAAPPPTATLDLPLPELALPEGRLEGDLQALEPIELVPVFSRGSRLYRLWRALLERDHYLGPGPLGGDQMRYLIKSPQGWLGAIALSAAARAVAERDQWVGWSSSARRENLHWVVNNSRFLIRSEVRVDHLASHVLAKMVERVGQDWMECFGYSPLLLESFVDSQRYSGVCYRAANWQAIGRSHGRGRNDRHHRQSLSQKVIWVYPLSSDFRQRLCQQPVRKRLVEPLKPPAPPPPQAPQDWAEEEFGRSLLKDKRLQERLKTIARDFMARPKLPLPQACATRAKTKAAYRFFEQGQATMKQLLNGHYEATAQRVQKENVVLAVQDTTTLNYRAHPTTKGLGPIDDDPQSLGLLVHDTIAYNLEGTPLGLIDVQCWARGPVELGKRHQRHGLELSQKESSKWLNSFRAAQRLQQQCPQTTVVSMGDQEADMYELLVEACQDAHQPKVLIRGRHDRALQDGSDPLWTHLLKQPRAAELELHIPRQQERSARNARLEVHYAKVRLKPPKRKPHLPGVELWAVAAAETQAPEGVEPIQWLLLTTVPVENSQQAVEKIRWYTLRFQIEVYHRTLKSGCQVEQRQLGAAERIESCLAIDMVVAWRIAYLTKLGRELPEVRCDSFFEEVQWKALWVYATHQAPPSQVPTLQEIILMLAKALGGYQGRKGDGPPGTKILWRALQRLDDIAQMWARMWGIQWDPPGRVELLDSS